MAQSHTRYVKLYNTANLALGSACSCLQYCGGSCNKFHIAITNKIDDSLFDNFTQNKIQEARKLLNENTICFYCHCKIHSVARETHRVNPLHDKCRQQVISLISSARLLKKNYIVNRGSPTKFYFDFDSMRS